MYKNLVSRHCDECEEIYYSIPRPSKIYHITYHTDWLYYVRQMDCPWCATDKYIVKPGHNPFSTMFIRQKDADEFLLKRDPKKYEIYISKVK